MRVRFWLPVLLSSSTVVINGCADDSPVVPADGSTSSSTGPASSSSGDIDPDSTGAAPECGNGRIIEEEGCDDDNPEDGDGCSSTCMIEDGWQCNGQPSVCFAVCGDALVVGPEQCDDDDINSGDGCSVECQIEEGYACEGEPSVCTTVCGDGFVVGEDCDDGNPEEGDGCSSECLIEEGFSCAGAPSACTAICGDGLILGDELCDDDDAMGADGCDSTCMIELGWSCEGEPSVCVTGCGDGIIAGAEQCDDQANDPGDGCSAACALEVGWSCVGQPSMCVTECGDGFVAGTEQCDDDGLVAGDGCDAVCQTEAGYGCSGQPSVCTTVCGDGVMTGAEACDDGNIALGDGCNALCSVEFAWGCAGSPSTCMIIDGLDEVALGANSGCVLTTLGEVGCFGPNSQGEVGNGTTTAQTLPTFALDDAVALTSGENLNCAIRADGSVWCWGDNADLPMGPAAPPMTDQLSPIQITGLPVAAAIEAGDDHVCAIDVLGEVWCWGDNNSLQLGRGGVLTTDSADPAVVALPGGLTAIDLGMGDDHSCAVLSNQTVACWGDDDNGQLGDGAAGADSSTATLVPGLVDIIDVEGGQDDTCALGALGQVWCWGDNIDGQVGNGSTIDASTPQLLALPAAAQIISLGDDFACTLLVDDQVLCWGEASDFQVGSGNYLDVLVPTPVLNLPAQDWVDLEVGGRGACVVSAANERWCWGFSEAGQLGFAPASQLEPVPVNFSGPVASVALDPAELRGVMCGVLLDGTVECTGDGTLVASTGGLPAAGYFDPIHYHLTMLTPLAHVSDVQELGMGDSFICVRTSTNVQCWGDNSQRQLGQGGVLTNDILTPVTVMGLGVVDELDVGALHACVRTGGTVQCWGNNSDLQTGEPGMVTDQSLPVTVMGLDDATQVALGQEHGCALRATGVVSCWGNDFNGQLGDDDGNIADSAFPVDVTGLPPGVTQVVAGQDHNCALAGGQVYCWGEAGFGNLGQGNETDSDTALLVPGLAGIVQLAAGYNYNCAFDGAGDMWCWGYAVDGHLGNGGQLLTGLTEVRSPTPFVVASGITDVVAGNGLTCIETAAGWSCLGFRASGQLGDGTTLEPVFPSPTVFGL